MTASPCRWKHPVVAAQQVSRRRARPRCERPWFAQRPRGLVSFAPLRLGRKVGMHVVVEDVVVAARLVAAVRPPVVKELAGRRDHCRDEDEQIDRNAGADERRGEAAERMTDDDDLAAVADRSHDSVGVIPPAGRCVFAREIDGSRVVPVLAQLARDQVPIPGASAAAVDQRKGRHPSYLPTRYLTCVTLGASIARTCSSFSSGPTPSKSRAPPPSTSGTMFDSSTSTSPAARYWLMALAPPPMTTSLPGAASRACSSADSIPPVTKVKVVSERVSGSRSRWVSTNTGMWNGGSSPHHPRHGSSPQGSGPPPNFPRPMISAPTFASDSSTTGVLAFTSPPASPCGSRHAFSATTQSWRSSPPSPSGFSRLWFGPAT